MSKVYFTSDSHFGHGNIIKYCKRPFLSDYEKSLFDQGKDFKVGRESVEWMDQTLIDNINAVVGSDDILWHLGDFSFAPYAVAKRYRDAIKCQTMYSRSPKN